MIIKAIFVCVLLFKQLTLAIINPIELQSFPDYPVSQLLSSNGRSMHVIAGTKSFSYNNSTTLLSPNQFNNNPYLATNKSIAFERIDEKTIAVVCGVKGLAIISEEGVFKTEEDSDYNPDYQCSFEKISPHEYLFSFSNDHGINIQIYQYNGRDPSYFSVKQIIPSINLFFTCSSLAKYDIVICLYYKNVVFQAITGSIYYTADLSHAIDFEINQTSNAFKLISVDPNYFYVFLVNTNFICFAFEYIESSPIPKVSSLFNETIDISVSPNSYDIQLIQTKSDNDDTDEYKWLIIVCETDSCSIKKYNLNFNEDAYRSISIPLANSNEINKGVSLQLFSNYYISIIISQANSNYALTYTYPDCSYLTDIEAGLKTITFSNIANDLTANLNISFHFNDNIDTVLFTSGYLIMQTGKFYPFDQIGVLFKKKGNYSYKYDLINEDQQYINKCNVNFRICYYKCETCLVYGKEIDMQCTTCSSGYYQSHLKNTQCISKDECMNISGYTTQTECLISCSLANLLLDVEDSSCVSQCKPSQYLDKMTSQCLSQDSFNDKMAYYIDNIDKYITYLYKNHPFRMTDKYSMSIYNTSILPPQPTLEIIMRNSFERLNLSSVDLKSCKDLLITENKLNRSAPLIIAKFDYVDDSNQLTYKVNYFVYSLLGKKLDMSICQAKNTEIIIVTPIINRLNENITLARDYSLKGINVFDSSISFFNDFCNPATSDYLTDIPLINRIEYIYLDESILCSPGCKYIALDYFKNYVVCSCFKENVNLYHQNYTLLKEQFSSLWVYLNFAVIECPKLVFDQKKFENNLGSWFLIISFIIEFICAIYFFSFGFKPIETSLLKLFPNNNDKKNVETHIIYTKKEIKDDLIQININNKSNNGRNIESEPEINKEMTPIYPKKTQTFSNNNETASINDPIKRNSVNTNFLNMKKAPQDIPQTQKKRIRINAINNVPKIQNRMILNAKHNLIPEVEEENDSKTEINQMNNNMNSKDKIISSIINTLNELESNPSFNISFNHRNFIHLYWLFLKNVQPIIQSFFTEKPYNTRVLNISIFFLCISLSFTFTTFYLTTDNITKSYLTQGRVNYFYTFPKIIYSFLTCYSIKILFNGLSSISFILTSFSKKQINGKEHELNLYNKKQVIKRLKIRLYMFFILKLLILLFFWYYVSAFCAVYHNIQMTWIICGVTSFLIQMLFPFALACFLSIGLLLTIKYKIAKLSPFFTNFAEN